MQAAVFSIEGHPDPTIDGVYTHVSTHKGWPVLKNANGNYCYRYTPTDKWLLSYNFRPDSDRCSAAIVAKEGPLPVGSHDWRVYNQKWQEWENRQMNVALFVRFLSLAVLCTFISSHSLHLLCIFTNAIPNTDGG